MKIRQATSTDNNELARMRNILWPAVLDEHLYEINRFFSEKKSSIVEVFVVEITKESLAGFIELNIRSYAEGSNELKVPYIEGWYIAKENQGLGYGRQLVNMAEKWAKDKGFKELASDTPLTNTGSIDAHKALGFREVEKIVCFIKALK